MWPRMHFLDLQGLYAFWTAGVTTGIGLDGAKLKFTPVPLTTTCSLDEVLLLDTDTEGGGAVIGRAAEKVKAPTIRKAVS